MKIYELNGGRLNLTRSECFAEATKEELRVLLALIEADFNYSDETELAKVAKTTKSRVISALALFESEGVIKERTEKTDSYPENEIVYEFKSSEAETRGSCEVACDIRDEGLAALISECTAILNKATLQTGDVKQLVELYTDEGLSEEYIVTLASYLASGKQSRRSVRSIYSKAKELKAKGIDTPEALDAYIKDREHDDPSHFSFRAFFKIWQRPLSESELAYAEKWYGEFGYSDEIISKAYDAAVKATGGISLPYIDTVLTNWHTAGCRTLADCVARAEVDKAKLAAEAEGAKGGVAKRRKEKTAEVPKYGSFNIDEAFAAALERSYGENDN